MSDGTVPMQNRSTGGMRDALMYLAVFVLLALFYLVTAPPNHSLSHDSYWYARIITQGAVLEVEHPRLFLWLASMQLLYDLASSITPAPDVYRLVGAANALQAALAVVLFVRLLVRDLAISHQSAWFAAGLFAFTYGMWRYSTEIEVYATVSLLCVLLLTGAFQLSRIDQSKRLLPLLALACLGGVSTLVYQPVGFLAGIAVPCFLLFAFGLRTVATYCLISGAIVAGGTWAAAVLAADTVTSEGMDFILDTKAVGIRLPELTTPAKLAHGFGYAVLSTNWLLAFQPVQGIFASVAPQRSYDAEIYAAERGGALIWVAFATLPMAAFAFVRIALTALRERVGTPIDLKEATIWLWLLLHTTMIILLSPGTHEPWIPAFAAIFALLARRLIEPTISAGRVTAVAALVAVFFIHNAAVGLGLLAGRQGDYIVNRGEPLLALAATDDLVVMSSHRPFAEYLRHSGMTRVIDIREDGLSAASQAVEQARMDGRTIWFLDNAVEVPRYVRAESPEAANAIEALSRAYIPTAERHPLSDTGWVYEVRSVE